MTGKASMKTLIMGIVAIIAMVGAAGCSLLSDDTAAGVKSAILAYAKTDGKAKAAEYIDQLIQDGKITPADGEKLKSALDKGLDKLETEINQEEVAK